MTAFTITAYTLAAAGACAEQVALVREHFGDGPIRCTARTLTKAARLGLSVSWLERYIPAENWRAYYEATATARKAYDEAAASAEKAYLKATAPAWTAYLKATAPARATAYLKSAATARKAYNEAIAPALARALAEAA